MSRMPRKPNQLSDQIRLTFCFLLIATAVLVLLEPIWFVGQASIFQSRDLLRAQAVAAGQFAFFGPETSGGGFLPGGFYYDLISVPLRLGLGWVGVWRQMLVLFAAAMGLLWTYLRRKFGVRCASLCVGLCLASIHVVSTLRTFVNPSFLPIFTVAILLCFIEVFSSPRPVSRTTWVAWLLLSLFIPLAMQIHFTAVLFFLAAVLLQVLAPQLGLGRLPRRLVVSGAAVFVITLSPHFVWLTAKKMGHPFGIDAPDASGSADNSIWFILRQFYAKLNIFEWREVGERLVQIFYLPEVVACALAAGFAGMLGRRIGETEPSVERVDGRLLRATRIVSVVCGLAALPCFYALIVPAPIRYTLIFEICFAVLLALLFERFRPKQGRGDVYWLVVMLTVAALVPYVWNGNSLFSVLQFLNPIHLSILAVIVAVPILSTFRFAASRSWWLTGLETLAGVVTVGLIAFRVSTACVNQSRVSNKANFTEWGDAIKSIKSMTKWDYAQARFHIFYVNIDSETTLQFIYDFAQSHAESKTRDVDGFIVGLQFPQEATRSEFDPLNWLISHDSEKSLIAQVKNGDLQILQAMRSGRIVVLPYRFAAAYRAGDWLHNRGTPYMNVTADQFIDQSRQGYYATVDNCIDSQRRCDVSIQVLQTKSPDGEPTVSVKVFGSPVAIPSDWIAPDWVEAFAGPYVEVVCGASRFELDLADSIGFRYNGPKMMLNHSFLAPFSHTFSDPCRSERMDEVEFGYRQSDVASHNQFTVLPAKRVRLQWKPGLNH